MRVYAKAIVAFLTALLGALAVVVTGNETFADITVAEWIAVASTVIVNTAAVYGIGNTERIEVTETI